MDPHAIEQLRRSVAMLTPESAAGLTREEALEILHELRDTDTRLRDLRRELRRLADNE